MKKCWERELLEKGNSKYLDTRCVTRLNCCPTCHGMYLKMKLAQLLQKSEINWRQEIIILTSSEGHFYCTGSRICNKCL